jgi:hypothetical protein
MNRVAVVISFLALAGTIAPAVLYFTGRVDLDDVKFWMLISTIAWFAATPIWMERERS